MPLDGSNYVDTQVDKTTQILIRARRLLVEKGWTKRALARDIHGLVLIPSELVRSEAAVKFCALGAIHHAGHGDIYDWEHNPAVPRLARVISPCSTAAMAGTNVACFNNSQISVEPVLAAFDKAIAMGD